MLPVRESVRSQLFMNKKYTAHNPDSVLLSSASLQNSHRLPSFESPRSANVVRPQRIRIEA